MGGRRVLVIGSQCANLPNNRLAFLPEAAVELYQVLTDTALGGCVPALPDGKSLLIDPTIAQTKEAIATAMARASEAAASLFLAFIGHGERHKDNFYLLPYDASAERPNSERALLVAQRIEELLRDHERLDGLVLLVDTCYSAAGLEQAAEDWPSTIAAAGGRFEVLTAAAADRPAFDGCFTKELTALLRSGVPRLGENLRCSELKALIQDGCRQQDASHLAFDGRRYIPGGGDEGLWLVRNRARTAPLAGTPAWGQIDLLTKLFERTPQLVQLVRTTLSNRCVAVVGPAGVGKSTLAATLARSELAKEVIPEWFVHGLVFASPTTTASQLAGNLHRQLRLTVEDFTTASEAFKQRTPEEEWKHLDPFTRQLVGPLRQLAPEQDVRIVLDGLDQLPDAVAPVVLASLNEIGTDPALATVCLVVTARSDAELPTGHYLFDLDRVANRYIERYLQRRGVPADRISMIVEQAAGNWLVTRVLADLATDLEVPATSPPVTLDGAYRDELLRAGATDASSWAEALGPVLSVLAVAGDGPVLPLPLLCHASGLLGGQDQPARVRDVLVRLRGLVVRGNPGTPNEHLGTFHSTFAAYLRSSRDFAIEERAAHQALADAIRALAPMAAPDPSNPLYGYAAAAEAEHHWALGHYEEVLGSLEGRASNVPAENLTRSISWQDRFHSRLGPDDPNSLRSRGIVANWTGKNGDGLEALRLLRQLLVDQIRILGNDHPDTLVTRANEAYWIGEVGDPRELVRMEQAAWAGEEGDAQKALRMAQELLPDLQRVLGPDHSETLRTRGRIAGWTADTDDAREALPLFRQLIADQRRVLGNDHPDTLVTRANEARYTFEAGDHQEALRLVRELLPDLQRVRGPDHPTTLAVRQFMVLAGGKQEELRLLQEMLLDLQRVLGPDHPDTLATRMNVATLMAVTDETEEALRIAQELLPDLQRVLGPHHAYTLRTRALIIGIMEMTGDEEASDLLHQLMHEAEQIVDPDAFYEMKMKMYDPEMFDAIEAMKEKEVPGESLEE